MASYDEYDETKAFFDGSYRTTDNVKADGQNSLEFTYIDPITGESKKGIIGSRTGNKYKYQGFFNTSTNSDVYQAIQYVLKNGWDFANPPMSNEEFASYIENITGNDVAPNEIPEILSDVQTFINTNIGNYSEVQQAIQNKNAQQSAFDEYYNDLYSLEQGTLGREILDNYTLAEQNAALSNMELAEAQYQQAAMQQAETVKAITDSVKAERMARLRAGMSESQIANQDMQTMLSNMNTLNQSMNTMNQNRYAAQQQYDLAQDTAYQQYINTATQLGSVGAAYSAAGAGSADYIARQIANQTGLSYQEALKIAQTGSKS